MACQRRASARPTAPHKTSADLNPAGSRGKAATPVSAPFQLGDRTVDEGADPAQPKYVEARVGLGDQVVRHASVVVVVEYSAVGVKSKRAAASGQAWSYANLLGDKGDNVSECLPMSPVA